MALVDELVQKITIKADTKALDVVQKKEQKLIATTNTLSASLKSAFKWIGGGLLVKNIIDASITMDSLNRSFEALAGGAEDGRKQIQYLRDEALRLGQDFRVIAGAYKNFFAVGRGAGMATSETQNIFTSILEASTVLGSSTQSVEGALLAVEQMISKGKVSMEELRRQLGNALPGAMQIGAKAMGVTTAELEKMITAGLDSQMFVKKFAEELKKNYSGDKLTGPVKSLRAEFARLKNALFELETGLLEGETGKAFAELVRSLSDTLTSDGFKLAIKGLATGLNVIMKNLRLIVYYLLLYKGINLLSNIRLLKIAMQAYNKELALSGSLSMAMGAGFKATLKYLSLMMSGSLVFAKNIAVALGVLLMAEDLIASLVPGSKTATKRAGNALGGALSETPNESLWKQFGRNLVMMSGGAIGALFTPDMGKSYWGLGETEITIPQQSPNITINQNIATGASADEIAERTKQTLTGMFTQYSMGGVK